MTATIHPISAFNNYREVRCYTLKLSGNRYSEFFDFINRIPGVLKDKVEFQELMQLVRNIADDWGLVSSIESENLIEEENAHRFGLPFELWTTENSEYGLRLYCVIVGPNTMIILNGDLKTKQWVEECENCKEHFYLANAVALAIKRDLKDGTIGLDLEGNIEADDDYQVII